MASKSWLLALAYLSFVSLGLPDAVLGLAWPSLCRAFSLPPAALGLPLAASAATYFVSGLLAGRFMKVAGVGNLLAISTVLVAFAIGLYAAAPGFSLFLAAACIVGFGSGAIDAGLNTYAAQHFGARHMTWLHAAYSTGAALGSATMTLLFANGLSWRYGYASIAAALSGLAIAFVLSRSRWSLPSSPAAERTTSSTSEPPETAWAALRSSRVLLQAAIFFVYTGVEVGLGQWSYTILTQGRKLDVESAGLYVTSYWVSLLLGRVLAGFVVEAVGTVRLLRTSALVAALGGALFSMPALPGPMSSLGLVVVGLSLAPIYPGLMSETPRRVGAKFAPHAVGFQVSAATAGVAILPSVAGLLGERFGLDSIALFIAGCALVLFALHERLLHSEARDSAVS